jgi:predicted amidohydrolase YtcJ
VIIENGVVRTMDLVARRGALAIAGERIVGGVGTHESALPTPERVDLRKRCVLPAFSDAHVHFPTWSLSQRDVDLEGVTSLVEALDRVASHPRHGEWIRGRGWRDALWDEHPSRGALDAVTGDVPAALWAKDYHSLWVNTAGLARAGGDLELHGGIVERDAAGGPTGSPRSRGSCDRHVLVTEDEHVARRGRGSGSRTRAGSLRSTTRTAGSARTPSSPGSTSVRA